MVLNIPWDGLHKIRNTLNEAVQKFIERGKFVAERSIKELDFESLR